MKAKWDSIWLIPLFLSVAFGQSYSAAEKKDYPPTAAHDALETACQQAVKESKAVFLKSGFPECGWCRVFDRYHSASKVQKIIGKYYVVVSIDTKYMPDGEAVFSQYAKPGGPSWVIITPQKEVIVDSYAPEGNVGYPLPNPYGSQYLSKWRLR